MRSVLFILRFPSYYKFNSVWGPHSLELRMWDVVKNFLFTRQTKELLGFFGLFLFSMLRWRSSDCLANFSLLMTLSFPDILSDILLWDDDILSLCGQSFPPCFVFAVTQIYWLSIVNSSWIKAYAVSRCLVSHGTNSITQLFLNMDDNWLGLLPYVWAISIFQDVWHSLYSELDVTRWVALA